MTHRSGTGVSARARPLPDPTPKQMRVLLFIRDYRIRKGYSPTLDEIAAELDVSRVTALEHVVKLDQKGFITRRPKANRSILLNDNIRWPQPEVSTKSP